MTTTTTRKRKAKRDGLSLRGDIWYFRRMINGERTAVSTGCKDRRQAERRKTELDKEMNDGTFGWKKEDPKPEAPTIAEYFAIAQAVLASQDEGERSVRRLTRLARFFPDRTMDSLTVTDCQTFLHGRATFGLAQNSVRAEHIVCRAFWNRAIKDKLIPADNPWKFKGVTAVARRRVMTFEEQRVLWPMLPVHIRRAMTVILLTGLRSAEARGIEITDIDFVRGQIDVRAEIAKGGKQRYVPLPPDAATAIRDQMNDFAHGTLGRYFARYRQGDQRIFPYAQNGLILALRPVVKKAGLPVLTVHDLRRTFGTRCAEANVPMRVLQMWMGHASISITEKFYTNVDSTRVDYVSRMVEASKAALDAADAAAKKKTGTDD